MTPSDLFLRGMGLIYFIAFFSLWRELLGLYGSKGIVPIAQFMSRLKNAKYTFWKAPTLFWISSSDSFLQTISILGMIFAGLTVLGAFTPGTLFILWLLYLSFCTVGSPFLDFQWDRLLLESGFYAFLYACGPLFQAPMTWVLYLLMFRLMVSSGIVKLLAITDHWRTARAMDYHYESQPLPNTPAYFMHQQPRWFSTLSVYGMLFFELIVPWLIFGGESARHLAFILLFLFQWVLIFTGNFAFFNFLTIILCLPLLEMPADPLNPVTWALASFFIVMNLLILLHYFFPILLPARVYSWMGTWGLISSYGLFANMTKGRHEIIIEGSDDANHWIPYEFFYKPQVMDQMPTQIAPLQPRLEWQLWFIPSVPWRQVGWFVNLLERLLEGSKPVSALFKHNPFQDSPPKYVRALLYSYKFTDLATWKKTRCCWTRTFLGAYTPPIHLAEKETLR